MAAALRLVKQFRVRELAPSLKSAEPQKGTIANPKLRNPFLPFKNPETGRWAPAKYSLRRQAELIKSARASGMLHLLPPGLKLSSKEIAAKSQIVAAAEVDNAVVDGDVSVTEQAAREQPWWSRQVEWEGEIKEKEVKGADVGNKMYAGRKRMFKGHKWQRTQQARLDEQKRLMKDMKSRIERFKTTYRRKTPSPTSPARPVSYSKLPF